MPSVYEELAAQIVAAQKAASTKGAPQILHTTIEGGYLPIRDTDGNLTGTVGEQYDGTFGAFTVAGPNPPKPDGDGVSIKPVPGGVLLSYNGTWESNAGSPEVADTPVVAPMDFRLFEVHASKDPSFTALMFDTKKADILSARGGEVLILLDRDTDYWFRVIARSRSGKVGTPSDAVGPFRGGKGIEADFDIDFSKFGGTQVFYGDVTPTGAVVGDIWYAKVGTAANGSPLYETRRLHPDDGWTPLADQGTSAALAKALQAIQDAQDAQDVANGKVKIHPGATQPTGLTADDVGDLWYDPAAGNAPKLWDGDSWEPRKLGNGAIQPNSLIASDVVATGTITAALFEAIMILATVIILGDANGTHTRLSSTGVVAYADDPVDGTPNEIARFGGYTSGRDPNTGQITWSINEQGQASFKDVAVGDTLSIGGETLDARQWVRPRGVASWGFTQNHVNTNSARQGAAEVAVAMEAGRAYRIGFFGRVMSETANDEVNLSLRSDGAPTPTINSASMRDWYYTPGPAFRWVDFNTSYIYNCTTTHTRRMLVAVQRGVGSGLVNLSMDSLYVEDIGLVQPDTLQISSGGATGTGTTPPPTAPKVTRTDTWLATWSRSWKQNNTMSFDGWMYQGYGDSFNGVQTSACGFPDLVGVLAGATINRVEIYLYSEHWWNAGGGTAGIGCHNSLGLPGGFPGIGNYFNRDFARNQGQWIDVTGWGNGLKDGSIRGISLAAPGGTAAAQYYGRFRGVGGADVPSIRVTYTK